jgi:hypothetical protein
VVTPFNDFFLTFTPSEDFKASQRAGLVQEVQVLCHVIGFHRLGYFDSKTSLDG